MKVTSGRARVLYASLLSATLLAAFAWAVAASATSPLANIYTVTNTKDDGTGSLREAITDANVLANVNGQPDIIKFDIPATDPNCNASTHVCTIKPTKLLPNIIDPVVIDGYTQPGARPNSLEIGNDAVLLIELSGEAMAVEGPGLNFEGVSTGDGKPKVGNSTVRGLVINRFKGTLYFLGNGIHLQSSGNHVEGCFIGTDANGTADLGNASTAVFIGDTDEGGNGKAGADNNVIGGASPAQRNLLSGNDGKGIDALFSNGNKILGNYIGTTRNGDGPLGNEVRGVLLNGSHNNTVGGTTVLERNVISANHNIGIYLASDGNKILGNFIGTNAAGTGTLGNTVAGVLIEGSNNRVGGKGEGEGNIIASNVGHGVSIIAGSGNALLLNAIFGNVQLGIDLKGDGAVQPNDHLDRDTGPNNLQNFPEITSALSDGVSTIVTGSLDSMAETAFRVEFFSNPVCDSSGNGEGQVFLGSADVQTDRQGVVTFSRTLSKQTTAGQVVTATATRLDGFDKPLDTSEFSACRKVIALTNEMNVRGNGVSIADGDSTPSAEDHTLFGTVTGGTVSHTFTIENTGGVPLTLTGTPRVCIVGTNASDCTVTADFTVTAQPDSPVPGGGQTAFTIRFSPSASGLQTATVLIGNDDADENPYDFSIQGGTFSAPPSITPGAALALRQGSTQSGPTIANVSDAKTAPGSLIVTATNVPTGISVSNIVNTNGNVTANVAAGCTASVGANAVELTVTNDGGATATASLTVNVSANTAPTLTYANPPPVAFNGSASVSPATGPSDNGSVAAIDLLSQGTFNGTISVNSSGVIFVGRAAPVGTHTITVRATDNCGTTTDATFTLTVPVPTNPTTLFVTNTDDSGPGSLRQTMLDANALPNAAGQPDTISFDIPASDRNCDAATHVCTIKPTSALPDITDAVVIDGYTQPGAKRNTLAVGDDAVILIELDGTNAGDGPNGLHIKGGNSTVRGLVINRFKGNRYDRGNGIYLRSSGNRVEGCFIGTDATGTAPRGYTQPSAIFIGDTDDGGNGRVGADNNVIGGTTPAERNLLSGNGNALDLLFSSGNAVLGNYMGTARDGKTRLGNTFQGIVINLSPNNIIGGAAAGARNVISGNGDRGIYVFGSSSRGSSTGNRILGNFIGTNADGTDALGNGLGGVQFDTGNNTLGGTAAGEGNVISGNNGFGVDVSGASTFGNSILGNFIGTDVTGTLGRGNSGAGVNVESGAHDNDVRGNVISANLGGGVAIKGASANNAVVGNTIALNAAAGVVVNGSTSNSILQNSIFSNAGLGIDLGGNGVTPNDPFDLDTGSNNLQNFPTLTSAVVDANGATVTGRLHSAQQANYRIELFSSPSCDPSGNGEGQKFLGALNVITRPDDGSKELNLTPLELTALKDVAAGEFLTTTATRLDGSTDTSEFSPCVAVVQVNNVTLTVTNLNDSGPGSLRQAVNDVQAAGGGAVSFAQGLSGLITLTSGPLVIGAAAPLKVNIVGPGSNRVVVSGNNAQRVFNVGSGVVNISGLTIANGFDDVGNGGGIVNSGSLTLDDCRVVGNRSTGGGGGIANLTGGTLTINNCDITNNVARHGGGIANIGRLSVTNSNVTHNAARPGALGGLGGGGILNAGTGADNRIEFSTVSFNEAGDGAGGGGGIRNFSGLTVESCTVSDNNTNATLGGGGLRNDDVLTILNSTVSANSVFNNFDGGGVSNGGNALVVINSTVSGNSSNGRGGGIRNEGPSTRQAFVLSSTIAFNSAALGGGGFSNDGELNVRAAIFARNESTSGGADFQGALNSFGFNLVGKISGAAIIPADNAGTDLTEIDPKLDPLLRNNGGTTRTHALLRGSPAIDAGGADVIQHPFNLPPINLSTDQRGRPRPGRVVGFTRDPIDIGAVEVGFNISGRVSSTAPLAGVTMTLASDSAETRTTTTDADGLYEFNDVPRGDYNVIPQFFGAMFFEARERVTVADDVSGVNFGWALSAGNPNDHSDAIIKVLVKVKESSPTVFVKDATVTLSGPKSAVNGEASAVGEYTFTELPRNGDYKLVATHPKFIIRPVKCRDNNAGADASGGCLLTNLPLDEPTVEFEAVPVDATAAAPPPPPLNDDFFSEGIVRERFNFGVLSLDKCDSAAGPLGVEQGDGRLKITPFASQRPAPCQPSAKNGFALTTEPSAFNGYVSVRDVDLNKLTSISVKADETLGGAGAHTIFSVGRDNGTFFRVRVGDGSFQNTATGQKNGVGKSMAADSNPAIFFETDDPKFSFSAPFKRDEDVFWRLRMETVSKAAGLPKPDVCKFEPDPNVAQRVILFETSRDGLAWTPRHCAPVARSATQVAAELLAGLVGRTNTNPGTARFSNYRVADQTLIKFNADSASRGIQLTPNVNEQEVTFKVERTGAVESGAVVSYEFDQSAQGSLRNGTEFEDCTAESGVCSNSPTGRLAFQPGSRTAFIKLRLHLDRLDPNKNQSLKLVLKDEEIAGGAIDGSLRTAEVSIGKGHPLDRPDFFVRQQYLDFLNRNPDDEGREFWTNEITSCGGDVGCAEVKTINVSAAFFLSIEFQRTGFVAYHFRQVSFGVTPRREDFVKDAAILGRDVVVNQTGWEKKLAENEQAFVDDWINRPAFKAKYDALNHADYVDTLYRNAGVEISPERKAELTLKLLTNQTTRREVFAALMLPKPGTPEARGADEFKRQHFNRLFVLMQYFGYLRRDPDDAGFNFWLGKLNEFNGDFIKAEMVKAFLTSDEYRRRFGGAQAATSAGH